MLVAVLSDIHSNLKALDAVLGSLGTVDAGWHLGDLVGYGPEPAAVVERLRQVGSVGGLGNHGDAICGGRCHGWAGFARSARSESWAITTTRSAAASRSRASTPTPGSPPSGPAPMSTRQLSPTSRPCPSRGPRRAPTPRWPTAPRASRSGST